MLSIRNVSLIKELVTGRDNLVQMARSQTVLDLGASGAAIEAVRVSLKE